MMVFELKKFFPFLAALFLLTGCATVGGEGAKENDQNMGTKKSVEAKDGLESTQCKSLWAGADCSFGQTARYEDARRDGTEVVLDVSVQKPMRFTPGKDAEYSLKVLGGETTVGPDNLYFDIEIKNLSEEVVVDDQDIELSAASATDGDFDVRYVDDGDIEALWDFELEPGQSAKFRSGWNFSDATDPSMKINIDGIGGGTISFSEKE